MSSLPELQRPIDEAIYVEVLACMPKGWKKCKLVASETKSPSGGVNMKVSIDGMGQPGLAVVSDALEDRVRQLFLLHGKFSTELRGIEYSYTLRPDGRWAWEATFDYPP